MTRIWAISRTRSYFADVVTFEYAENAGAFLSVGADWPPRARYMLFTVGSGLLLGFAILGFMREQHSAWSTVGLILMLGGRVSNLLDRFARGTVIDFMNVRLGPVRTGIFNVADVAITLGVVLLAMYWSRGAQSSS